MKGKFFAAILLASLSFSIGTRADITNGLVLYLALNETTGTLAGDSSTNGNNATLNNFPDDDSQWVAGRISGAVAVNPAATTNQYLTVPDNASLNFTNNLAYTLAAWVKASATQTNGACIIAKGTGGSGEQYALDVASGKFRTYARNAGGTSTALASTVAPNNGWQHVAAVYDGAAKTLSIYINGQLNVSTTNNNLATLRYNTHEVSIGCREGSAISGYSLPLHGSIDDARIYNVALTASDIQQIYLLAVGVAPQVTTQPQSLLRYVGENVNFTVSVDGNSTVPLSYQWQKNSESIAGATNAILSFTNLQFTNAGSYSVQITNTAGTTTSSNGVLQVLAFPAPNFTNNLVAYWAFDEISDTSAADSSGNGHVATLNNFTNDNSQWVSAIIAGGLNFNADGLKTNVVTVPDSGSFDFSTNLAFTLAAWVNGPATQTSGGAIIAKGTGAGGEAFALDIASGKFRFFVRDGNTISTGPTSSLGPNATWQHVAGVFDGSNAVMRIYVNGQLTGSVTPPTSLLTNAHEVSSGSRQSAAAAYNLPFTGIIDDLRVYNRALNSGDVQALYYMGGAPLLSATNNGNLISISWPVAALEFHLQGTNALAAGGAGWTNIAATPTVSSDGTTQTVTENSGTGAKFYRLRKP